ncbi:hypothetical protein [Cryobacterium sp. TMT4-31]|uniref:hypothetical protein n=1 Tax=Cryobacterium sp. TMT4-31 TaxID=1259259 RepID=UPI00106B849B|nr:hypothetical protein [Cryobacterium sp. TMT4-31]TFC92880.1 hypothetical protein E3T19_00870 [Cryobacterium sp. TMT4-31]
MVGSTHFKQTKPGWQKVFLSFYREFPQFVNDAERQQSAQDGLSTEFHLWKAIGDELIFEVEVRDEQAVGRAVRIWLDAVKKYEDQVLEDANLALKGGAFIATFPGPDSESTIPRKPGTEASDAAVVVLNDKALKGRRSDTAFMYDYFGPSIDTGFRINGLASRRYFTVSIEVAWAMALAAHHADASKAGSSLQTIADFVFRGAHVLKGVWQSREYPVFAVDREHHDSVNIAMGKLNGKPLEAMGIIDVCRACSADQHWPFALYLPDSSQESFRAEPIDAMGALRQVELSLEGAESQVPQNEPGTSLEASSAPLG